MNELKELYIEPTSKCNLYCVMCSRNRWKNETTGNMDLAIFNKVIDEIPNSVSRIFFGGVGEPLCHPDIIYMIRRAKATGRTVEMITNGTLLDSEMSGEIVDAGLDMLWVSLDSMEEESFENIRSGAKYGSVMDNIRIFNEKRICLNGDYIDLNMAKVKLGIAFVLMKNNLTQFEKLLRRVYYFGIAEVKATHLIPYEESQIDQICYNRAFGVGSYKAPDNASICVDMPLMDVQDIKNYDMLPLFSNSLLSFSFMGTPLSSRADYCRFVQEGVTFVRWDGEVCPCMALLHENTVYQQSTVRHMRSCSYGNVKEQSLPEIWESETYSAFRRRVINFEFSICTHCSPCDLFETNEEDCFGNKFPTCGPCLWAQGLLQCP